MCVDTHVSVYDESSVFVSVRLNPYVCEAALKQADRGSGVIDQSVL